MQLPPRVGRAARLLAALAVAVGLAPVAASGQSLAELARQEEARRKTIKAPSPVYTNEDVTPDRSGRPAAGTPAPGAAASGAAVPPSLSGVQPPSPSGVQPPSPSGVQPPAADAEPPAADAPAAAGEQNEAFWRQRIEAAREALQRAQIFAEALQSRINALTADFTARDDPAQRAVIETDRQRALAELDRVRQEIEQHTKAIADIREEARRAGVPPGWLR